ncbi:citrate synthase/methylcitrate synthase [Halorhabdus sp. CBA1104]|uniref:citrate/2-methylcitrate synthase n=1 Tax=unclassified Halorhabdus TaxID=2621901 RepID=UPI0012B193D9|nr:MULTISPECIES: citrate/2-methylcitrate synthase [unclassified Halorhabdus]QGN06979.1 citrate synthase/methylcitrate synthase [Halorhabdus sp. CBA1104]
MTDDEVHEGLADVTVAQTRLSDIDGEAGQLWIAGYPVAELAAKATYPETVFLLLHDRLPDAEELEAFEDRLCSYRTLPEPCHDAVVAAAQRGAGPMAALRMGAATATAVEPNDPEADALRLIARLPTITATYWRVLSGKEPIEPRLDLSHAANYLYMLTGEEPTDAAVSGLETYLTTVVDHGFNASTFTARTIVSTESELVSAITGAIGALRGDLHGGAPDLVLEMLEDLEATDDVRAELQRRLERGDRLMGFGHRVYEARDPRAAVLEDAAAAFYAGEDDFFAAAKEIEGVATELLTEYRPALDLETNVEFYTAVLLHGVGIPPELFTPTFAISRVAGWTAHCLEQRENNRLIRPRSTFVGDRGRAWTPIDER